MGNRFHCNSTHP